MRRGLGEELGEDSAGSLGRAKSSRAQGSLLVGAHAGDRLTAAGGLENRDELVRVGARREDRVERVEQLAWRELVLAVRQRDDGGPAVDPRAQLDRPPVALREALARERDPRQPGELAE